MNERIANAMTEGEVIRYAQAICNAICSPGSHAPDHLIAPCYQHRLEAWAIAGLRAVHRV
jgi:hypothetical protein